MVTGTVVDAFHVANPKITVKVTGPNNKSCLVTQSSGHGQDAVLGVVKVKT